MLHREKLLEEIIPGIAHKSRNLLMNISGRAKLINVSSRSKEEVQNILSSMTDSCDQLQLLLDKLVVAAKSLESQKQKFNILHCLKQALDTMEPEQKNLISLKINLTRDTFTVEGESCRLDGLFSFLMEGLRDFYTETRPIYIEINQIIPAESAFQRIFKRENKEWLHISIRLPFQVINTVAPRINFFNPEQPFNLSSCYFAAVENIIFEHHGKIEYCEENLNDIHIYFPEARAECCASL